VLKITFLGELHGQYQFDFFCTDCGGYVLAVDGALDDQSGAACKACGAAFGRFGDVKARALAIAHSQRGLNDPVVIGYRFSATLQLRTPYRILRYHGLLFRGPADDLPQIAEQLWQGIWLPETKTFRELGLDVPELPPATMASQIGLVTLDGGELLQFLLLANGIADGHATLDERREAMGRLLKENQWAVLIDKLGGERAFDRRLVEGRQ
jgi:hypothetical protein